MNPTLFAIFAGVIVSVVGFAPLAPKALGTFLTATVIGSVVWAVCFYAGMPSTAFPMWGWVGGAAIINLCISVALSFTTDDNWTVTLSGLAGGLSVVVLLCVALSGATCFRANDYAAMIGKVDERDWKADFQPIDPKHIALVPYETASFLADKELGEAKGGALGSQYHLDKDYMTLQRVNQHLWWVVPLDFDGWLVWRGSDGAPGYVMVDAEDPRAKPKLVLGHLFKYTPNAWFGDDLKRHLWAHGYADKVLTDYSFEIDEEGKPWWVVTAYVPSIAYKGAKVLGVAIVNPETGDIKFEELGKVSAWVDRVMPKWIVEEYVNDWGKFWNGYWNTWSPKDNLRKVAPGPGDDIWIVYGNDGEPYWAVGVTSNSSKDGALVGMLYMNARTGDTRFYAMSGQAEQKVSDIMHNKVKYQNLKPARLYLFNVSGRVVWLSTLIGEAGTFNGVALVDADTSELFVGEDEATAFRLLEAKHWQATGKIDPSATKVADVVSGKVLRIGCPVMDGGSVCFLLLEGGLRLTGAGNLLPVLTLTQPGDSVTVSFIKDGDPANPHGLMTIENPSLLPASKPEFAL